MLFDSIQDGVQVIRYPLNATGVVDQRVFRWLAGLHFSHNPTLRRFRAQLVYFDGQGRFHVAIGSGLVCGCSQLVGSSETRTVSRLSRWWG